MVLGETHFHVGICNGCSVWILIVLDRLISRELLYTGGVSEYDVLRCEYIRIFTLKDISCKTVNKRVRIGLI